MRSSAVSPGRGVADEELRDDLSETRAEWRIGAGQLARPVSFWTRSASGSRGGGAPRPSPQAATRACAIHTLR